MRYGTLLSPQKNFYVSFTQKQKTKTPAPYKQDQDSKGICSGYE